MPFPYPVFIRRCMAAACALVAFTGVLPAQAHFPLAIGNWWEFTRAFAPMHRETVINSFRDSQDRLWYLLDHFRDMDSVALCFTAPGRLLLSASGREQLYLDFTARPGTHWRFDHPRYSGVSWNVSLEAADDTVVIGSVTYTSVHRFHFQGIEMADNDWSESYAPATGPVLRTLIGFGVIHDTLAAHHLEDPSGVDPLPTSADAMLLPIHPAPFTESARVAVDVLRSATHCRLIVVDVLGRECLEVYDGTPGIGRREFVIDGATLPPGAYFLTMDTPSGRSVQPMVKHR